MPMDEDPWRTRRWPVADVPKMPRPPTPPKTTKIVIDRDGDPLCLLLGYDKVPFTFVVNFAALKAGSKIFCILLEKDRGSPSGDPIWADDSPFTVQVILRIMHVEEIDFLPPSLTSKQVADVITAMDKYQIIAPLKAMARQWWRRELDLNRHTKWAVNGWQGTIEGPQDSPKKAVMAPEPTMCDTVYDESESDAHDEDSEDDESDSGVSDEDSDDDANSLASESIDIFRRGSEWSGRSCSEVPSFGPGSSGGVQESKGSASTPDRKPGHPSGSKKNSGPFFVRGSWTSQPPNHSNVRGTWASQPNHSNKKMNQQSYKQKAVEKNTIAPQMYHADSNHQQCARHVSKQLEPPRDSHQSLPAPQAVYVQVQCNVNIYNQDFCHLDGRARNDFTKEVPRKNDGWWGNADPTGFTSPGPQGWEGNGSQDQGWGGSSSWKNNRSTGGW